jgi:hypothetical protein
MRWTGRMRVEERDEKPRNREKNAEGNQSPETRNWPPPERNRRLNRKVERPAYLISSPVYAARAAPG